MARRWWSLGVLAVLAVALVPTAPAIATSATSAPRVDHQAWFASQPVLTPGASPGEIYVGAALGSETARAFGHLDFGDVSPASIGRLTLQLAEGGDSAAADSASVLPARCYVRSPATASSAPIRRRPTAGSAPRASGRPTEAGVST